MSVYSIEIPFAGKRDNLASAEFQLAIIFG